MQSLNADEINDTFTVDMHYFPPRSFTELMSKAQKIVVATKCIIARHKHRTKQSVKEIDRRPLVRN